MIDGKYIVRLAEDSEVHTEGGVVHGPDNVVGEYVEKREDYFRGNDCYVVTTGEEGFGRMASYEIPAEQVEEVEEIA